MALNYKNGELDNARRQIELEAEEIKDPETQIRLAMDLLLLSAMREMGFQLHRLSEVMEINGQ